MKRVFLFIVFLLIVTQITAQKNAQFWEAMDNDRYEEALEIANQLLAQDPKSSTFYVFRAAAYEGLAQYGNELNDLSMAIKCWNKKDSFSIALLYDLRASAYMIVEDNVHALKDLSSAIKSDPKNVKYYVERGKILSSLGKYSKAEADFRKALSIKPYDIDAELAYIDCLTSQQKIDEASARCEALVRLYPTNEDIRNKMSLLCLWRFDVTCYIDHYIEYMEISDYGDIDALTDFVTSEYDYIVGKINEKLSTSSSTVYWLSVLVSANMKKERYDDAILSLNRIQEIDTDSAYSLYVNYKLALCYINLYEYTKAIRHFTTVLDIEQAQQMFDYDDFVMRGMCYARSGNTAKAMEDYNIAIENVPFNSYYYKRRAILNSEIKEYEAAKRDFDQAIGNDQEGDYSLWLLRGKLSLQSLNDPVSARADFMYVIENDTMAVEGSIREQALHFLGRDDEAEAWMNQMLEENPGNKEVIYQAACLFSLIGKPEQAVDYLRQALDMGFRNFYHIQNDSDLDNIRNREEFRELMSKYQQNELKGVFNSLSN